MQRLANLMLDGKLDEFVTTRRAEGKSWRIIARDLYEHTDNHLDVTFETLRTWYADTDSEVAS